MLIALVHWAMSCIVGIKTLWIMWYTYLGIVFTWAVLLTSHLQQESHHLSFHLGCDWLDFAFMQELEGLDLGQTSTSSDLLAGSHLQTTPGRVPQHRIIWLCAAAARATSQTPRSWSRSYEVHSDTVLSDVLLCAVCNCVVRSCALYGVNQTNGVLSCNLRSEYDKFLYYYQKSGDLLCQVKFSRIVTFYEWLVMYWPCNHMSFTHSFMHQYRMPWVLVFFCTMNLKCYNDLTWLKIFLKIFLCFV